MFRNGLEKISIKNSGHDECDEIHCLSAVSLDINAVNSLNFRNLAVRRCDSFLDGPPLLSPKMKSPSGSRT